MKLYNTSLRMRAGVTPTMMLMTYVMVNANGTAQHREGLLILQAYKVISVRERPKNEAHKRSTACAAPPGQVQENQSWWAI